MFTEIDVILSWVERAAQCSAVEARSLFSRCNCVIEHGSEPVNTPRRLVVKPRPDELAANRLRGQFCKAHMSGKIFLLTETLGISFTEPVPQNCRARVVVVAPRSDQTRLHSKCGGSASVDAGSALTDCFFRRELTGGDPVGEITQRRICNLVARDGESGISELNTTSNLDARCAGGLGCCDAHRFSARSY